MAILGAHMSIAGGYYKAVDAAAKAGCQCVQLFTKNNNQWRAKPIVEDDVRRFAAAMAEQQIGHPISHASYLINLASPAQELWTKSIDAMIVELLRAEQLGVPYVVVHPGAYTTSSEAEGIARVAAALDEVHGQAPGCKSQLLLETTAGQGSCLGCTFEQLAGMIDASADPDRLGVCLDTCHVFAAGYAIGDPKSYRATMTRFGKLIGHDKLKALHLNDSLKPLGSRVDRHAHIGRGELGLEPFRLLLNDRRFKKTPMYLETPKGEEDGEDLDVINLRTLRGLVA
ncbi:Endonuclease 4 [Pirellulimonas nuda]|uniref:Probable endonuclease 4 n=1 Tax=Pirellulimonas nuda TaxID=2528009 RepID=A0A518DEG4_9BACT|nr:deoxyribonuclease IV [Pirellulimonas nuda]QDU89863.1 Endonuclease 4 [Pirellulimonas nuda]